MPSSRWWKRSGAPDEKREIVQALIQEHKHTQRQACRNLGFARSTAQYRMRPPDDTALIEALGQLIEKHPSIGDVRGMGLFWAVELVKNRDAKEPFNTMADKVAGKPLVVDQIAAKMMGSGVAQQAWVSHFVIAPPLIVTEAELDEGINALDEALVIADALAE